METIQLPASSATRDIFFKCEHCSTPLVVDCEAAGMALDCQRCGKSTAVPPQSSGQSEAEIVGDVRDRQAELERRMKENESQRTEIFGYINQLSIQLHRWKLRMQTLLERQAQLTAELHEIQK
jgi:transcription elongation factor Elf1